MSGHTPGPWQITKMKAGAWDIYGGANAYYPVASRLSTVEHMEDESYANAHLIAAAPDLLAALKALAACEHDPKYAPEVIRAGNAIIKAESKDRPDNVVLLDADDGIRCPLCGFGRILRRDDGMDECTDCGANWKSEMGQRDQPA